MLDDDNFNVILDLDLVLAVVLYYNSLRDCHSLFD
jgi:hypothetical protein